MKFYITFFSFLVLSSFGIQNSFAQKEAKKSVSNTEKEITLEQRAKMDVYNMGQSMELSGDQKSELNVLFIEIQEKINTITRTQMNVEKRKAELATVNEDKTLRLKQILSEEQYEKYLKML
jgi:hypothetical protein